MLVMSLDNTSKIQVFKPLKTKPIVTKKRKSRIRINKAIKKTKSASFSNHDNAETKVQLVKVITEEVLPDINVPKTSVQSRKKRIKKTSVKRNTSKEKFQRGPTTITRPDILHTYLSHEEISSYLDYIKNRYRDFVKVHLLGHSYEKRAIKAIEINWNSERNLWAAAKDNYACATASAYNKTQLLERQFAVTVPKQGRNIVFIEGGTHAREWISIAVALHSIYQLTERNIQHRDILRKLRFFIVPLVNPDGYEYTRSTNPRWRKNRRPHNIDNHVGTDCNRNFDFHWEERNTRTKRNTYQGEKPFSEPETRALAKVLRCLSSKLLFFLSLHSYATSIMYPWGYTRDLPKNAKTLEEVAITGRKAIKAFNGREYSVGSIASLSKRLIAGSVVDYVYGVIKAPVALVMELPSSEYGFQPPRRTISSLGHESWVGIKEMCRHAYSLKLKFEAKRLESSSEDTKEIEKTSDFSSDDVLDQQLQNMLWDAAEVSRMSLS